MPVEQGIKKNRFATISKDELRRRMYQNDFNKDITFIKALARTIRSWKVKITLNLKNMN